MIRIIIMGLVAFVPSVDNQDQCVLLVDATAPLVFGGYSVPEHHAAIRVHGDRVDKSAGRRLPDRFVGPSGEHALFFLRDEKVELVAIHSEEVKRRPCCIPEGEMPDPKKPCCTGAPGEVCEGDNRCPGGRHPYDRQRRDFSWVLDLGEIVSGAARAKGDCFEVDPPDGDVEAQLRLPAGELFTFQLEGEPDPANTNTEKIQIVRFPGSDGFEPRAAARKLALEIKKIPDDREPELRIRSSRFSGEALPEIRLTGEDGLLEVIVMNSPTADLHDPDQTGRDPAPHFGHYYRLSRTTIPREQWLIPWWADLKAAGDLLCPPVTMQQ